MKFPAVCHKLLVTRAVSLNELLAYTRYAFFEWALIFTDIGYDAVSELEFTHTNLQVSFFDSSPHFKKSLMNSDNDWIH